jgi:hypothetical protein
LNFTVFERTGFWDIEEFNFATGYYSGCFQYIPLIMCHSMASVFRVRWRILTLFGVYSATATVRISFRNKQDDHLA